MNRSAFVLFACLAMVSLLVGLFRLLEIADGVFSHGGAYAAGQMFAPISGLVIFAILAINFSPWAAASAEAATMALGDYQNLSRSEKAEFIANEAARRLGVSSDKFSSVLSDELRIAPCEVMNLLDDLGAEYSLSLSADDYPGINSIDAISGAVET